MMMKIGVISDTHLQRVSRELQEIFYRYLGDAEMILHAGDFVSREIVSFLSICKREVKGVILCDERTVGTLENGLHTFQ